MIKKAEKQDERIIRNFLLKRDNSDLFMLSDLNNYGISSPFHYFLLSFDNNKIEGILLKFHNNIIYAGICDAFSNIAKDILENENITTVMGRPDEGFSFPKDSWNKVEKDLLQFNNEHFEHNGNSHIKIATIKDLDDIHTLLLSRAETAKLYSDKRMIEERIKNKDGQHVYIEKNSKVIAHCNTAADNGDAAMLGGLVVDYAEERKGLAHELVSYICADASISRKKIYVISEHDLNSNLFIDLGFMAFGKWCVYTH